MLLLYGQIVVLVFGWFDVVVLGIEELVMFECVQVYQQVWVELDWVVVVVGCIVVFCVVGYDWYQLCFV